MVFYIQESCYKRFVRLIRQFVYIGLRELGYIYYFVYSKPVCFVVYVYYEDLCVIRCCIFSVYAENCFYIKNINYFIPKLHQSDKVFIHFFEHCQFVESCNFENIFGKSRIVVVCHFEYQIQYICLVLVFCCCHIFLSILGSNIFT